MDRLAQFHAGDAGWFWARLDSNQLPLPCQIKKHLQVVESIDRFKRAKRTKLAKNTPEHPDRTLAGVKKKRSL
jgi:hypothetical protein